MVSLIITKKDLKALFREKTIVFTLLLLVALSSLSQIIATGLMILYNPTFESSVRIGLVGNAPIFEEIANPIKFEDIDFALRSLEEGYVDAVVVLNESVDKINYVEIYIPKEEVKAIKVIPSLRKVFQKYQEILRKLNGIPTLNMRAYVDGRPANIPEGISLQFKFIYIVLIPTIIILCGIIVGIYTIDILYEEKRNIEVILTSVSLKDIVLGKILAVIMVSTLLTLVWIICLFINGTEINFASALPSLLFSIFSSSVAMIIFGISENREQAQFIYSLIFIPLVLSFLTFTPSPISISVKFSLSIFDSDTVLFAFIFGIIDLLLLVISYKIVKSAITKSL